MKRSLLRTLLSLLLLPPAALAAHSQTTNNAEAYGYFYGPDGNLALVEVIRTTDANKITTTELFYTFCGQTNLGTSCQQGDGIIPNSATTGGVNANKITAPDTFTVNVDTSAVAGYRNQICTLGLDLDGDCLGEVAATGGLVSISWTRTNQFANLQSGVSKSYQLGKLVFSDTNMQAGFSANQAGTVLGVNASSAAFMATASDSQTLQTQFAARKVRK